MEDEAKFLPSDFRTLFSYGAGPSSFYLSSLLGPPLHKPQGSQSSKNSSLVETAGPSTFHIVRHGRSRILDHGAGARPGSLSSKFHSNYNLLCQRNLKRQGLSSGTTYAAYSRKHASCAAGETIFEVYRMGKAIWWYLLNQDCQADHCSHQRCQNSQGVSACPTNTFRGDSF